MFRPARHMPEALRALAPYLCTKILRAHPTMKMHISAEMMSVHTGIADVPMSMLTKRSLPVVSAFGRMPRILAKLAVNQSAVTMTIGAGATRTKSVSLVEDQTRSWIVTASGTSVPSLMIGPGVAVERVVVGRVVGPGEAVGGEGIGGGRVDGGRAVGHSHG